MESTLTAPAAPTDTAVPTFGTLSGYPLRNHGLRLSLTNEVHARPPEAVRPPLRASRLAMFSGESGTDSGNVPAAECDRRHLARLCEWGGAAPPPEGATHYSVHLGSFSLKWERHTEFSTYTIFRPGAFIEPFAEPAVAALPREWLAGLAGELMVGIHVALLPPEAPAPDADGLMGVFGSDSYIGAHVTGGHATTWTDLRIHGDGFSRILIADHGLGPRAAGRLVQRLMEIETYRMMALLALPVARTVLPRINDLESRLAELTARTASLHGLEDERRMLDQLTQIAAENEQIAAETSYRFGAARAYYSLVERRINELREERIEGLLTIGEFMDRRLGPAIRTCEAVAGRREALSERVARTTTLLRTRIDIALEGQNADLLRSMDRRAQLQLQLQETVEGLSVVAISYYLIGILGYGAKGLKGAGLPVDTDLLVGLAIPAVLAFVWMGVRRIRKAVIQEGGQEGGHGSH